MWQASGVQSKGKHFTSGSTFSPPAGVELDELPADWFTTSANGVLEVRVHPKGVTRVAGGGWQLSLVAWPFSWVVHWCFFRGQWWVEVIEKPRGIRGVLSPPKGRYRHLYRSRRSATTAADSLAGGVGAGR